ncbi:MULTISPECIES: heavy metal sensor histidine kinase [unclassified Caballeronia]|uniref:heavy metal sensor histidine kinase n=1 Tax=unclassified Caballeronia TaxID=2646786 RepID=UPI002854502A|nr:MULTISPECIES: heavy metal sensor histidine kinase [unclassified Caballeronia]MDR5751351.1 heavy metal sensor histidine kinase [Caballeronia sp. LZ024]MDR5844507.1 heavy metal sensor histidine kinase [Caballeronia sp. LZ031]
MSEHARHYSLSGRLAFAFLLVAAMVFALMGAFLYTSLSAELQRRDDIEIDGKLSQFLQLTHDAGTVAGVRSAQVVFHEILLSHPGVYLAVLDKAGTVVAQHSEALSMHLPSLYDASRAERIPYTCAAGLIGSARCVFANQTLPSGEPVRILLARTAADRESLLGSYRLDVWGAAAVGSTLVGLLGYLVARRGLTPVKSIGRQASRIEADNLSERLNIGRGPVELNDIAVSVNRMLDRLERAFVRLSQFSSDLAHDMRTPLANVISSSQITLSKTRSVEEYETLIDSNIEECERLQRMIENMLFLARTDNARQGLRVSSLDIGSELRRLASYFQGLADESGHNLVIEGDGAVKADTTMFRRAVSNLVSNALDHAAPSSTIILKAVELPNGMSISVTNSGKVIPPVHLGNIFDRFYRIDPARHDSGKNSGLGLAIVKSIMELHRGHVEVESGNGRTTFTLTFPKCVASPSLEESTI